MSADPLGDALVQSTAPVQTALLSQEAVTVAGVVVIAVLIVLSAFFASSEIAIFSLGDHRIAALVEEGASGAATLERLKEDPRRLLVTILVGNNVVNIGMSSIATGLLGMYLGPGEAVVVATFGVTSLVLLFGESAPKSYAVENSESLSLRIAGPLRGAQVLMYPLVEVFDRLTSLVNRAMGSEGDIESAYVSRSEVREMIRAGQRDGVFTDEEHRMLQRLLRFRNRIAKETMAPRVDVVALDVETDLETAVETVLESGFSRVPVYEGTLDAVVGIVDVRTLLDAESTALSGSGDREAAGGVPTLRDIADEPFVVPETKDVDELLAELRRERRRMAVVVDEFGTTAGVVTIEDIVEEIIGEVLFEDESVPIRRLEDGTAVIRGETNVHAVNEALGVDLPETAEYESIAGLILSGTGRLADPGDSVCYDGVELVVERVQDNRILEVRLERDEDPLVDRRTDG